MILEVELLPYINRNQYFMIELLFFFFQGKKKRETKEFESFFALIIDIIWSARVIGT